jgi:two-component system, NarL family, nitrate/nitrite response regulator NarL
MSVRLRILIVDDHELVRRGIAALLLSRSGVELCGEASNGEEAIQKAAELRPDLIILDVTMPVLNGLEAARRIREFLPSVPILMLSMHDGQQIMEEVKLAGAQGFLSKNEVAAVLLQAIDTLVQGGNFFAGSGVAT